MSYTEESLQKFIDDLGARTPTPGGGAASALVGVLGTALANMTAAFTTNNEKFKAVEMQILDLLKQFAAIQQRFITLMDDDIHAFATYAAARHLPKDTPEQKRQRSLAIAAANEEATCVPEQIVATAVEGMQLVLKLGLISNPRLAGDLATAAYFIEAAACGAAIQVMSNCAQADTDGKNAARRRAIQDKVSQCRAGREAIDAAVLKMLKLS